MLLAVSGQAQTGCFNATDSGLQLSTMPSFAQRDLFFIGEFHGVHDVPAIRLALIKYLNQHEGITDVFMEMGYSAAFLYNSFLETGDTAFITHPLLVCGAKAPDRDFWMGLYDYNQTLSRHIVIHAMDFERIDFIRVLKLLSPTDAQRPAAIAATLNYIDTLSLHAIGSLKTGLQKRQDSIYEAIRADYEHHTSDYAAWFGDNYPIVKKMLSNPSRFSHFSQRNNTMYRNVMEQVQDEHIAKCIVVSGMAHANKEHTGSLYSLLAASPEFTGKTTGTTMLCKNCYDWQEPEKGFAFKAPYTYNKDTSFVSKLLDKYSSPDCKFPMIPARQVNDQRVRNYSDYIILLKNQPGY